MYIKKSVSPNERKMKVMIYASELAACIGKNKFKNTQEATRQVWKRHDNESYIQALKRNEKVEEKNIKDVIISGGIEKDINTLIKTPDIDRKSVV